MRKKFLLMTFLTLLFTAMGTSVLRAQVAKVGNTEYATIDEAIAAWTNNTTLTLLADVTLSDVVTINSTEHHILNLSTYTMTAASGKNAFVIKACGNGSAERSTITINADATNPGGIDAGSKCIIYYKYADGGISTEDRPIIKINGGVFTGSTSSWGTAGIYTIGTAARKCATVNVAGGTFDCSIVGSGKSKLIVSGGLFNYTVSSQGDSTCSRLISGGTFKTLGFMTADDNNTKFWIGTSMGNSNVGTYIDDNGYLVVGGPVVDEPNTDINEGVVHQASTSNYGGWSSYLKYSSANDYGLYYTNVEEALADNNKTSGSVTVYVDELDMTGISYKGTIVVPEDHTITITNAPENLKVTDANGNIITPDANGSYTAPAGNDFTGYTGTDGIWGEVWGNAKTSFVIKVVDANGNEMGTTSLNNIGGIIDGDVNVTWNIKLDAASNTDQYWTMEWTTAPTIDNMPAKVELWVDGVKVSGGNVVLNGPDEIDKIYAAVTDEARKIYSYHKSIADAITAINNTRSVTPPNVIALLRDTDEAITLPAGITLNLNDHDAPNVSVPVAQIGDQTFTTLQAAIDAVQNGETIELLSDVTENVTLTEATDLYYTIDGGDKNMNGTITVNPLSDTNDNRRITISNINFVEETDANVDFISAVSTNHYPRLTISGCDFTGSGNDGDVAIRLKSSYSVVIENCTGTGLHSFLQNTSGCNLTINNVTVTNSKSGLALGTVQGVTVKDSNIDVNGYGIRLDAQYNNNAVIESNVVEAFIPVVVRKAEVVSSITFSGTNTMTASNTDGLWCAIGTSEYETNGTMPTAPTGQVTVTLNDTGLSMDGVYGAFFPVKIGETGYATLAAAAVAAQAGETITLFADVTEDVSLPAGITLNGNGKQINGSIVAGGDLTIKGHTKATSFNAGYNQPIITIGAGACLEITGTGRMVIGHGATFSITGTITDAKNANVADLTPSLIMPGASFTGAGVTFNVTNAYISAPSSYCSSSSSASGTFDFNITNSIWESAGKLAFESQSTAATVNFELKDSKLTTGSHLVFGVSRGEVVIDNSNVNVGTSRQIENQSTMTVKNGSVVNGSVATSSNAKNPGTLIVDNATYAVTGEFSGSDLGTGTIVYKNGATISVGSITKANIQIDATGMAVGNEVNITANLANLAGTIEVINTNMLDAKIVDGKIVLVERTLAGEGTADNPYLINDISDLEFFRDQVNADPGNNYAGKYIKLTADIDLNNEEWTPIGNNTKQFQGYFDGNNKTISNLKVTGNTRYKGFFGYIKGTGMSATTTPSVKDLTLDGVNVNVEGDGYYVGGLAGQAYTCNITNVTVKGNVSGKRYVGGLVGHVYTYFKDCRFIGNASCSFDALGGIAGAGDCRAYDCSVIGDITGSNWVGGIVGNGQEGTSAVGCYVKGDVKTSNNYYRGVGGIAGVAGHGYPSSEFKNNYFDGEVYLEDVKVPAMIMGLVNANNNASIEATVEGNSWNTDYYDVNALVYVVAEISSSNASLEEWITGASEELTKPRNNNLIMLESDLPYVTEEDYVIMSFSEVTEEQVEQALINNAVAKIGETTYTTLQKALDAAVAGTGNVTVEIIKDIDLTNVDWNPVTVSAPNYPVVTVNGNNKTITGLNDMLFAGTWAGGSGLIINNLTIANSNIVNDKDDNEGTVGVGAFIGFPQASATITLNNCHLVNSTVNGGHWTGGLIGYAAGYAGTDGPVFMELTITGCSVTGSTITGKGSAGGIIGHGSGNAWTDVVIENTTVSNNIITSTGTSTNKAGAIMGTIGAAGQPTTVNGVTHTGGATVSAIVSGNTVKSNNVEITTIYGRQGTNTGMLELAGGTYDNYPIEEDVAYAKPAAGFMIKENADGTYGLVPDPAYGKVAMIGETYYETLSAAFAAVTNDEQTVVILSDVTEKLEGANLRGNITTKDGTKVTITLTNVDWVPCPYTFILGENITLNVPALFYYAGGAQINGTVVAGAYYQRYAGTKLTINEPGSMKVTTETFIVRYMDADPNAGIYIIGDNNDETIGLDASVIYFYQGMINAKDADIKVGTYWQTNETDNQGSANLVLDNSNMTVTVNEHNMKATANSTVTLTNGSNVTVAGGYQGVGVSIDATSSMTMARSIFVSKINNYHYTSLQEAATAAQDGETIELLWQEGQAPIAMNASLYGNKNVTITGTATVDWSKGFLFVGRGGEGNAKLTFESANLTSASNSASYGIHVSGREKGTNDKYDGTLVVNNSTIDLDYLINKGTMTLDNSTLTVKNGFSVGGRPGHETESGVDATATITLSNNSKVVVNDHNGMGLGYEAIGVMNINSGSTFETTEDFLITAKGTMNVNGGNMKTVGTLTNNGAVNVTGESILDIETLTGTEIYFLDGAIIKNSTVGGEVFVAGKVTFRGNNTFAMLYDFGTLTGYYGTTANMEWTVEEGASLTLTNEARYGLGYGDKVTVYGEIEDALTARENLTENDRSLFMHGLVAQESSGFNCNSKLTVNNAYVVLGSNNSFGNKSGNYGGNYTFNFKNSVVDGSRITFYEASSITEFTFEDSDVKIGTFMTRDTDSKFTLKNSKVLSTATNNGTDEGNYNAGELTLDKSSLTYSAAFTNVGTLNLDLSSKLTAPSVAGDGIINIDATNFDGNDTCVIKADMASFEGVINVEGAHYIKKNDGIYVTGAQGTLTKAYTSATGYWGECGGNANESFVLKFYNDNTYMGQTSLNDIDNIIDGDVYVTWSIDLNIDPNAEGYWDMSWDIRPTLAMQPNRVEQWIDGEKVAECAVEPNWADNIFPVVAAVTDENDVILSYVNNTTGATLNDAFAAGGNIAILRDFNLAESVTVPADKTVVLNLNGKTMSQTKACTASYEMINNKGNLTITGNGKLSFKDTSAGDPNFGWGSYTVRNEGNLVVENGTIEHLGEQNQPDNVVHMYCAIFQYSGSSTINDGTISTPTYRSARLWKGDMTINGGTFDGQVWVQAVDNTAKLTIKGGTFEPNGGDASAVFVTNSTYDVDFAVTGGTFETKIGCNNAENLTGGLISGGNFSATAAQNTSEDFLAEGFAFNDTPDANGYYTVIQVAGTQTREFAYPGWYWFSTYIDFESGEDGLDELQEQLGDNAATIKGQKAFTNYQYYNGVPFWTSALTSISASEMYMIKTTNECLNQDEQIYENVSVSLEGDFVDYENYEITIHKGWNWIGYPLNTEVSVRDALAEFTPAIGDQIKGKIQGTTSTYMSNNKWIPNFNMIPGEGYMYYSAASENKTLTYSAGNGGTQNAKTSVEDNHWIVDEYKYSNNMTVIAMLSIDGEIVKGNYEVAAFANGECRGSARPIYIESIDAYVLFMTIHGDEVEELTFMYYDIDKDTEYELSNVMNYSNDAIVGTIDNPYIFSMNILGIGENSIDNINIYPNPTTTDREINLQAICDKVEVFNALGVKVAEYHNVDTLDALETAGIYVIRITNDNAVKHCRLVVK